MTDKIKNKGGRPSKLNEAYIKAAKEVIDEDMSMIIYTDLELMEEINDRLPEESRICDSTFENWKAKAIKGQFDNDYEKEFLGLIKKALRKQKKSLMTDLSKDTKAWQRFAWILERKFTEWNLKHITDNKHQLEGDLNINIVNYKK